MKAIFLVTFAVVASLASGYVVVPKKDVKYADHDFLVKQKAILEVLQHVHQHEVHTQLWTDSKTYKIEEHYDSYTNVEAVKEFISLYHHGMLGFDEIFTVLNEEQRDEVTALFNIFYYAKDWPTFYKTMVWARFHVNEGMFVYALTTAILHRTDFVGIELPAIYEIYPYYFFHSEVIQKAHQYKMQGFYGMKKVEDVYNVVIPANYTGWYMHTNVEQKVSYFTEDIGLNAWYYYLQADFPYWLGSKEFGLYKDRRDELYLFNHRQLLARYYLERLSNDLETIPSVLEQFETPLRDPVFYQSYKRISGLYWQFKEHLPYTEEELIFPGLKIKGVEMDELVTYFDKFDADISNAVDAEVYDDNTTLLASSNLKQFGKIAHYLGEDFVIKARCKRLNTVPFTYKLMVNTEKAVKGVVRAYLGPKYDTYGSVYQMNDNKENFVLLDIFAYEFKSGKNQIVRNSNNFTFFVKDRTTFSELYKQVMIAYENDGEKYQLHTSEAHTGFPARLMLPKGKKGGMPFQLYFIVSPFHAPTNKPHKEYMERGYGYIDSLPYGYPFDREINENYWFTPNMYYYDVNIFHKKESEINASNKI